MGSNHSNIEEIQCSKSLMNKKCELTSRSSAAFIFSLSPELITWVMLTVVVLDELISTMLCVLLEISKPYTYEPVLLAGGWEASFSLASSSSCGIVKKSVN